MSLSLKEIKSEPTGFKPGDRIAEFVARCWITPGFEGLRFAYGATEDEAVKNLSLELSAEASTK